jgi:hypothetical protein
MIVTATNAITQAQASVDAIHVCLVLLLGNEWKLTRTSHKHLLPSSTLKSLR